MVYSFVANELSCLKLVVAPVVRVRVVSVNGIVLALIGLRALFFVRDYVGLGWVSCALGEPN